MREQFPKYLVPRNGLSVRHVHFVAVRLGPTGMPNIQWFGYGINDTGHLGEIDDGWGQVAGTSLVDQPDLKVRPPQDGKHI